MDNELTITPKERLKEDLKQRLARAVKDLKSDADLIRQEAQAAAEDNRFIHTDDGMWAGWFDDKFANRAKVVFDNVSDMVSRFIGQWNTNRVSVEYKPDNSKTSDEDTALLNGIFRKDWVQNSGKLASDNAVDELATTGYGALILSTRFEDQEDTENDLQRIQFSPIHNSYCKTIWDRNAKRIDKRDARRCTVLEEFSKEAFLERWPDKAHISAYEPDTSTHFDYPVWSEDVVYVAKRYEVLVKVEKVFVYFNLETEEVETYTEEQHEKAKDQLAQSEFTVFDRERKVRTQSVEVSVFNGEEYLEKPRRIVGKYIPIIPFYGIRAFVDGRETSRGLVRKQKDPSRVLNVQISKVLEDAATGGQRTPIFAPKQMPPQHADHWEKRASNPAWLPVNPLYGPNGELISAGPLGYVEPNPVDPNTAALIQITQEHLRNSGGGAPQDTIDPSTSGKAVNALIKREDLNKQQIMDNIVNAHEWMGTVYQAMASEIYTGQRIMRIIDKEGKESEVRLNEEVIDEETERAVVRNTLTGKRFSVVVSTGPQYDTIREQGVEEMKGVLEYVVKIPQAAKYVPIVLAEILKNMPGVDTTAIQEMARKDLLLQGAAKPETDEEKELVRQASEPKPDENEELVKAAAEQARAEADNLKASAADKMANVQKKAAETAKIESETEQGRTRTFLEIRKEIFATAQQVGLSN